MEKIKEKPVLVIAGPGAGKTYDVVSEVVEVLPNLKPNRVLAVITYTNAATDSIRGRLCKAAEIPPNVFIGTNHSFLNQFILMPYATLFGHVSLDKLFLEIDVKEIVGQILHKQFGKKTTRNYALKNRVRSQVIGKLLRNGMVPFGQIAEIAADLMQNEHVRDVVCNRIQYLFIDEFQDADTYQFKVFDAIRKSKKTRIYAVGDPEQYILGFTYDGRPGRKPKFKNIPISKFVAQRHTNDRNRRSFSEIVDFTNHFHTEISQTAIKGSSEHAGVFFILDTEMGAIISRYRELTQVLETDGKRVTRFYLGYENRTFEGCVSEYGLTPVSNDGVKVRGVLSESLKLVSAVVGLSQKQIREKYDLDHIDFRKLGIKLIKAINEGKVREEDEVISFVKETLGLKSEFESVKLYGQLRRLMNLLSRDELDSGDLHQYTSIHKAKGLEADAVLVVAKTENELKKWLTTNEEERRKDTSDRCRIGFVGFSRAKQILCIACKRQISDALKDKLRTLGVHTL